MQSEWRYQTLEYLENDYWGAPEFDSHLVRTCHALRKKPISDFSVENLRIMIGQSFSLRYLIPLALEVLEKKILAGGDFYEGDLLKAVLESDPTYWRSETENWKRMCNLFNKNRDLLTNHSITPEIKNGWFSSFANFEHISQ